MDFRLIRLACRLRLVDVWAGTGISTAKLSAFERGRAVLSESEQRLLIAYLRGRWAALQALNDHSENANASVTTEAETLR